MKKIIISMAVVLLASATLSAAEKAADKNIKVLDVTFAQNMKFNWPFSTPSLKSLGTTIDLTRNSYGADLIGKDVKCVIEEDGSTFVVNAEKYFLQNPRLGLRLGGKCTIKLPVIKGMSLVSVKLTSANVSTFGRAFLAESDDTAPVAGGEALKKSANEVDWNLSDTKPGQQYSILVTNSKTNIDITGIRLIYAKKAIPTIYGLATGKAKDGDGTYETLTGSFTPIFAGADEFKCGFDYKLAGGKKWTSVECDRSGAKFSQKVTDLKEEKNYVYKAWVCAPGSKKKVYGDEMTFSTSEAVVAINFAEVELAKSKMPGNRDAMGRNAGKIAVNTFGTDVNFKFWSEYGVSISTNGGKPIAISLNPSKKLKDGTFDFGGVGNAWLKFPGIDGKRLTKIEIKFVGGVSGKFNVSTEVTDGIGNKDIAEPFRVTSKEKEFTFEPENLEKGQGCYLCAEGVFSGMISEIALTYSFK